MRRLECGITLGLAYGSKNVAISLSDDEKEVEALLTFDEALDLADSLQEAAVGVELGMIEEDNNGE